MTISADTENTRVVRPWIAALLTIFLGWGVGFYYARRKSAWWWAIAQVLAGVIIVLGLLAIAVFVWPAAYTSIGELGITLLGWVLTLLVAGFAWAAAARAKSVTSGGAGRFFGYLLIVFIPLIASLTLSFAVRWTTVHPFRMPSGSMQPTIQVGEYFLVNKRSYGYSRYSAAPFEALLPPGRLYGTRAGARRSWLCFGQLPNPTAISSSDLSVCLAIASR